MIVPVVVAGLVVHVQMLEQVEVAGGVGKPLDLSPSQLQRLSPIQ